MADLGLHLARQFAERLPILNDFEQRIVPKSADSLPLETDPTGTVILDIRMNAPGWIRERRMTDVVRRARCERNIAELLQQQVVVSLISGVSASEPRGIDAGRAVQGIDRQAAVFAQDPCSQMPGLLDCFQRSVLG